MSTTILSTLCLALVPAVVGRAHNWIPCSMNHATDRAMIIFQFPSDTNLDWRHLRGSVAVGAAGNHFIITPPLLPPPCPAQPPGWMLGLVSPTVGNFMIRKQYLGVNNKIWRLKMGWYDQFCKRTSYPITWFRTDNFLQPNLTHICLIWDSNLPLLQIILTKITNIWHDSISGKICELSKTVQLSL